MAEEIVSIKGREIVISYKDFPDNIDVDDILKIDHRQIPAEMVTFPVILNKLGFMLSEMEKAVKEAELTLKNHISKKRYDIRNELNDVKKFEKLTQDDIKYKQEAMLVKCKLYNTLHKRLFKLQKHQSYLNNVYWSAKDKSDKLNTLSEKMHPDELAYQIEKITDKINNIKLKGLE